VLGLALGLSLGAGFAWLVAGERPDWLRLLVAPGPAALPAETASEPPPARAADVAAAPARVAAARPALASASGRSDGPWVQLAALPTLREAKQTWAEMRERHAGLLAHHEPRIQRIERDGRELFRLRVGPFTSHSAAADLCRALRAENASCYVAAGL
jgi:cell division septation protein DedD